ncbi:MAG: phosphoglycerate dehydrogenase [Fidelibacterota bacterium]
MNITSFPKNKIKVLLLENIHPKAKEIFEKEGYSVSVINAGLSEENLIRKLEDVRILGIRSRTHITNHVVSSTKKLWAIGAFCIGVNQIDLSSCQKHGIAVFNAPFSNTRSVVELVMSEIIVLMRNILPKNDKLHRGIWDKAARGNHEVRGKKLGIIGYGNIGSQLSVLAESFGMQVYYYDITEKLALGNGKKCKSLQDLLSISDVVSIHVDGSPKNNKLIGKAEIDLMKKGAVLINASRGFVVDVPPLAEAVKQGKLSGAGIDVFPDEPKSNSHPFHSELRGLQNVILTPHIGGSTEEAQHNIAEFVPENIIRYMNSGNSNLSVNFPRLNLPLQDKAHRFIHIHENAPGVLAEINKIFGSHGINIMGQYLKTHENIGVVISDVDTKYKKSIISQLKSVKHTIKFRVLY